MDTTILTWQSVDTAKHRQRVNTPLYECPTGSYGRTVIMGKHEVYVIKATFIVLYFLVGFFFCPVALKGYRHLDETVIDGIPESSVTIISGRRAFKTQELQDLTFATHADNDVTSHLMPHLIVVGTYEGCVFLRVGLTFKNDNRNTLVEGAIDGWSNRGSLVWSDDKQIYTTIHQTVYLLYLALGIIFGCSKTELNSLMKVGLHLHL